MMGLKHVLHSSVLGLSLTILPIIAIAQPVTPSDSTASDNPPTPAHALPVRPDPELQRLLTQFSERAGAAELAAQQRMNTRLEYLRTEFTGTDAERQAIYNRTIRQYNRHSWVIDQMFRQPLRDRFMELINDRVPPEHRISASLGSPAILVDEHGNRTRNPRYTMQSDFDAEIGSKGLNAANMIARANGMHIASDGNSSDIFIDPPDPNQPTRPNQLNRGAQVVNSGPDFLQMTVNLRAQDQFDESGRRTGVGIGDPVGSSAQAAQMRADAVNVERFTHIPLQDGPAKTAISHLSLLRKSLELRTHADPARAFDPEHEARLQMSAKSAYKMQRDGGILNGLKIQKLMIENGLNGTAAEFRTQLEQLYDREPAIDVVPEADRINFVRTLDAIQDEAVTKANQLANTAIQRQAEDIDTLEARLKNNKTPEGRKMTPAERRALTDDIASRKLELFNARERLTAARQVTNELNLQVAVRQAQDEARSSQPENNNSVGGDGGNRPPPGSPPPTVGGTPVQLVGNDLPSTRAIAEYTVSKVGSAVTTVRNSVQKLPPGNERAMRGYQRAGKALGVYGDIMLVNEVINAWSNRDYNSLAQLASDETTDYLKSKALEALIPGSGQVMMAYYTGEMVGGLIGENVRFGAKGPTVNEAAETVIEAAYDIVSGNRTTRWEQERIQSYRTYMDELMSGSDGFKLPQGVSRKDAFNFAMEKTRQGIPFQQSMDELFDRAITEKQQLADLAKEEAEILASLPDPDEKPKSPSKKKPAYSFDNQDSDDSALQAFRANRDKEKEIANQTSNASGGSSLNEAFSFGNSQQQEHQQKLDEIARKKAKLREIQERTRIKRERRLKREAENRQNIRDLANAFSATMQELNNAQALAAARRPTLLTSSMRGPSSSSTRPSGSSNWKVQLPPAYQPPKPQRNTAGVGQTANPYSLGQLPTLMPTSKPSTSTKKKASDKNKAYAARQCKCYNLGKSYASGKGHCGGSKDLAKSNSCPPGWMGNIGAFTHGCMDGARNESKRQSWHCK